MDLETVKELEARAEDAKKQQSDALAKYEQIRSDIKNSEKELKTIHGDTELRALNIERVKKAQEELEKRTKALNEEFKEINERCEKINAEFLKKEVELAAFDAKYKEEVGNKTNALNILDATFKIKNEANMKKEKEYEDKLEKAKKETEILKIEISDKKREFDAVTEYLAEKRVEVESFANSLVEMKKEEKKLLSQIKAYNIDKEELDKKISELVPIVKDLEERKNKALFMEAEALQKADEHLKIMQERELRFADKVERTKRAEKEKNFTELFK